MHVADACTLGQDHANTQGLQHITASPTAVQPHSLTAASSPLPAWPSHLYTVGLAVSCWNAVTGATRSFSSELMVLHSDKRGELQHGM